MVHNFFYIHNFPFILLFSNVLYVHYPKLINLSSLSNDSFGSYT